MTDRAIYYSNPLPAALAHYTHEVQATLRRIGVGHEESGARPVEGRAGVSGRAHMVRNALANGFTAGRRDSPTIQLWPSLGLLEPLIWRSRKTSNLVVVHDPVPLRRQFGFDPVSRFVARLASLNSMPFVVSHSDDAMRVTQQLFPRLRHLKLLHPVDPSSTYTAKTKEPTVVVAGQYKPQRDLDILAKLGPWLEQQGIVGMIYGRGWPTDIPGWQVDNRFLPERELDDVLASAWCVLVPYRLYFQSGIALRALELGTLCVTPQTAFAKDLLGQDSPLIVDADASVESYIGAIRTAVAGECSASDLLAQYVASVDESWATGLAAVRNALAN